MEVKKLRQTPYVIEMKILQVIFASTKIKSIFDILGKKK